MVTGGAGFIGSNFILDWLNGDNRPVVNLDKLTYAGNLENLSSLGMDPRYIFEKADISDSGKMQCILEKYQPTAIINFAAESHVDRSIHGPEDFVQTNIVGTFRLLDVTRTYWEGLGQEEKESFRFLHVSTDEVYGSLDSDAPAFTEKSRYEPNSPYSASKASSDHLVRAFHHTYGLPVLTTNCSNNYGPFQFPEKLIPLVIYNALTGKQIPVYGDGLQIRDWLYVGDHCRALRRVLEAGEPGNVYNIGGFNEKTNIEVIYTICDLLEEINRAVTRPLVDGMDCIRDYKSLITHVRDRSGHDRRYAVDASRIKDELGWAPVETFETGMRKTIQWYLNNPKWIENVVSGDYRNWIERHYE